MKSYLESYRLDPAVSGYEWWLGFDWIAASNGIIGGHANNPKAKPGINNATLRNVQSEVVLLVDDPVALQGNGRSPGDFVPIEVLLSNWTFMGYPQWYGKDAQIVWTASIGGGGGGGGGGGRALSNGSSSINSISIAQGENGAVAAFGVAVPPVSTASKIVVNVTLEISGARVATNAWTLAVFPSKAVPISCPVAVLVAPELLHAAQQICSNAVPVPASLASQSNPFVLLRGSSGLLEGDVAAISRAGGFGVTLNPGANNSWPVGNPPLSNRESARER